MTSWILAARPKTLPAAVVPVVVGGAVTKKLVGEVDYFLLGATLLGAVFIQIATNFFNDAIDAGKGADTDARLGPVRATASGALTSRQVFAAGFLTLVLAALCGLVLIQAAGWPIALIGIVSCFFAFGYTGGPVPLAYKGLGELFVILFFGLIAVGGTVYVQTLQWPIESVLAGVQVGLLSSVLISINNLRDRDEDSQSRKRTLAVRLGLVGGRQVIIWEIVLAGVCAQIWPLLGHLKLIFTAVPVCTLGVFICWKVLTVPPSRYYNFLLALSAVMLMSYAVLFLTSV